MEERTYTRIVAVVSLLGIWGAALAITLPEQTREFEAPFDLHTPSEEKSLRDELLLCSQLNTTTGNEIPHCEEIWAENRRRFFSRSPQRDPSSGSLENGNADAPPPKATLRVLPNESLPQEVAPQEETLPSVSASAPKRSGHR